MAKVMFLQSMWYPLEGVMCLSAALKQGGHETAVSVGDSDKVAGEVEAFKPDIVAISVMTPTRRFMIGFSEALREKGYDGTIIIGGPDASFFPEIIGLAPVDALCLGEGDDAIVELADAVDRGEDYSGIKNLWVRRGQDIIKNPSRPLIDVNKRPFSDRDIYRGYDRYFSDMEFEQITVGRGCPLGCSFCHHHAYRRLLGTRGRDYCALRDPQKVIDEILFIKETYPSVTSIFFNCGTLNHDKQWLLEFCRLYREHEDGLLFTPLMHLDEMDGDVCEALASTKKCVLVRSGFVTADEGMRTAVLKKPLSTNDVCINAARRMREHGLRYSIIAILGLPGETLDGAYRTLDMAWEIAGRDNVVLVNLFNPFPKLDITAYGVEIGTYDPAMVDEAALLSPDVMGLFSNFRRDEEGRNITNLARLAHLYMRFPFTRGIIRRVLVKIPDNRMFRFIQRYTGYHYTNRHFINASWSYLLKYLRFHRTKFCTIY